jgi:predicted transglutaminase-like cysteine proteinase
MAHARKLTLLISALPALLAWTPALAESSGVSVTDFAKSEAIIGAPSALAAILAEQRAPARSVALQPAGYGLQRTYRVQDATLKSIYAPQPVRTPVAGVLSGKPDIFGSVALKVEHTPLDNKWEHVEHARVSGAAATYAKALRSTEERGRLEAINSYVNRKVRFVDDERQYGRADVWSTANSTLSRGRGDCEDYAIAKIQMLRAAGFSDRDIYLVVLQDLVRRADHAVAVVRSNGHMYVLDNGTDELLDSAAVADYRPILTFSAHGTWTHGYRVASPVTVASAEPTRLVPVVPAAKPDDQRSRSASLLAFNTGFNR